MICQQKKKKVKKMKGDNKTPTDSEILSALLFFPSVFIIYIYLIGLIIRNWVPKAKEFLL